jgi:hypothetical protein
MEFFYIDYLTILSSFSTSYNPLDIMFITSLKENDTDNHILLVINSHIFYIFEYNNLIH